MPERKRGLTRLTPKTSDRSLTRLTPSLLTVLVAAKAIALAGHDLPLSWWSPIAFFWHDVAGVLMFAGVANRRVSPRWLSLSLYAALVIYATLNVPVTRVLSTPLTWATWRAAPRPLSGSILHYSRPHT